MKSANASSVLPAAAPEPCPPDGFDGAAGRAITLSIVESDHAIRGSLRALLERTHRVRCVSVHADFSEALLALPRLRPDVMLLDARLLSLHGAGLIAKFKTGSPTTQILILTTFELGGLLFDAVCAGASGDLPKTTPAAEIIRAVQWVHAGGSPLSMPVARRVTAYFQGLETSEKPARTLTEQEQEILAALARGTPYPVIAGEFGLAVSTVLSRLRGVCDKLNSGACVT
jgi:DNA-binding NarL/FixJ family response regulator